MTETKVPPRGAVVVGVKGEPTDEPPIQAAVDHARLHHRPLHLRHATSIGIVPWTPDRLDRQRALTAISLARVRDRVDSTGSGPVSLPELAQSFQLEVRMLRDSARIVESEPTATVDSTKADTTAVHEPQR